MKLSVRPRLLLLMMFLAILSLGLSATRVMAQTPTVAVEFSQAQLDAMLAPIALYPDTVLSHVLIAATYPLEVVDADRWARRNSGLTGDAALNAVDDEDWDPSVKALVAFPDLLRRMSEDLDWTQSLGDAFLASEARVMDTIQNLRNRAYASGNLDKVEHVRVIREQKTIVIEPSVERVVYVPVYDTRVIYGDWWWPDYPPVYWNYPSNYVFVSGFYWGPRVYLGPRFYFSACNWRNRRVVVIDHHHHHSGPRFYDGRSIARYEKARAWQHNPVHRRNVAYHNERMRARYNSPQESYNQAHHYRDSLRKSDARIAPNRAREQRQGQEHQRQERRNEPGALPRAAGGMHLPKTEKARAPRDLGSNPRPIQTGNQFTGQPQDRAEQLRQRLHSRPQTTPNQDAQRQNPQRTERHLPNQGAPNTARNTPNLTREAPASPMAKPDSNKPYRAWRDQSTAAPEHNNTPRTFGNVQRTSNTQYNDTQRNNTQDGYRGNRTPGQPTVTRTPSERSDTLKVDRPARVERTDNRRDFSNRNQSGGNRDSGERRAIRGGREM